MFIFAYYVVNISEFKNSNLDDLAGINVFYLFLKFLQRIKIMGIINTNLF